ncbi:MAG: cobalt transporter CbiM [SAR324 cluster bacterium]|nr:cobalt transporter CbiM [SAR324 cluster bacterium]
MHIAEGIVSAPVLVTGIGVATAGTAIGLRRLDYNHIAEAGILSACFFVAGLIQIPIGPASAHLVLNGLLGILLGWAAFPALVVGLLLQALFFQFGGLTTLGINTMNLAVPAVICRYLYVYIPVSTRKWKAVSAFLCGFSGVGLASLGLSGSLAFSEENFAEVAALVFLSHIPIMFLEGIITAFGISFLTKVEPGLLPAKKTISVPALFQFFTIFRKKEIS